MHPAPSIILFTVLSGIGFGILAVLFIEPLPIFFGRPLAPFWPLLVAFIFTVSGLLASTYHLANKKNAIKAFRQVGSSWLSREAWASVITLVLAGLYGLWLTAGKEPIALLGVVISIFALITVFSTSMIYAQIKAVPRWHHWSTPALFIGYALTAGSWFFMKPYTIVIIILTAIIQVVHWINGDRKRFTHRDRNSATGLEGTITPLFPAHTSSNYLMKEMVYQIGRKHAQKLRVISFILGFIIPVLLIIISPWTWASWCAGFLLHIVGVFASRWLFFGEAEHSVALYYKG